MMSVTTGLSALSSPPQLNSTDRINAEPVRKTPPIYNRLQRLNRSPTNTVEDPSSEPTIDTAPFSGVQSLKQFWINAFGSVRRQRQQQQRARSADIRDAATFANSLTAKPTRKRTATFSAFSDSEHIEGDRTAVDDHTSATFHRNFATSSGFHVNATSTSTTSKSSDNFYKFKTADMVMKNQSGSSALSTSAFGAAAVGSVMTNGCTQIHWARRGDIIISAPASPTENPQTFLESGTHYACSSTITQDNSEDETKDKITTNSNDIGDIVANEIDDTDTISIPTSTGELRKTGVSRKCSFRTNKLSMTSRKPGTGSKVADLTRRFNQMCVQQDAWLIIDNEMRRQNGVIVHRSAGRVFKVIKEDKMLQKSNSRSSGDSSPVRSVRKRASLRRKDSRSSKATQQPHADNVNEDISSTVTARKPKVPEKSAQVIMRTKEIVMRNQKNSNKTTETEIRRPNDLPKLTTLQELKETDISTSYIRTNPKIEINEIQPLPATDTTDDKEESSKRNKYIRLYEKFRPSFLSTHHLHRKTSSVSQSADHSPIDDRPVQKIIDAISTANRRIENLSKSESCLFTANASLEIVQRDDLDLGQVIKPNQSFLFRSAAYSEVSPVGSCLVEAINPFVINKKTQSMDETNFMQSIKLLPGDRLEEIYAELPSDELPSDQPAGTTENDYEFIQPPEFEISATELFAKQAAEALYSSPTSKPIKRRSPDEANSVADCSDIYQSIAEVFNTSHHSSRVDRDRGSSSSYESFDNYQSVDERPSAKHEDGYEICDPPDPPPEPPPPRDNTRLSNSAATPKLPLPAPKRAFANYPLQTSESLASSNYEQIKYDKQPPRPPKFDHPSIDRHMLASSPASQSTGPSSPETEFDEENIYDTIKPRRRAATVSAVGNGNQSGIDYESLETQTSFIRRKRIAKSSADTDSVSTLSSDNKTNSLYGATLSCRESVSRPPSEGGENSDEWIDVSDGESEELRKSNRFVVLCERKRAPRNTDWSEKIRRQHQTAPDSCDDSEHFYESIDTAGNRIDVSKRHAESALPPHLVNSPLPALPPSEPPQSSEAGSGFIEVDYDSFDSDDQSDDEVLKNDGRIDVSNNRLPDPPAQTNQVYAFMQKIRNFGSLSKNLSKFSKKSKASKYADSAGEQPATAAPATRTYENTQFYVNMDVKGQRSNGSRSKTPSRNQSTEPYENTEFHSHTNSSKSTGKLDAIAAAEAPADELAAATVQSRKKSSPSSAASKSFKSKLRKSLGPEPNINLGSSFNGKRSTFYVFDSSDMDSGVFTNPTPPVNNGAAPDDDKPSTDAAPIESPSPSVSPEIAQRKSSLNVRPLNPPPPPPVDRRTSTSSSSAMRSKRALGTTSWYAECAVFKSDALKQSASADHLLTDTPEDGGRPLIAAVDESSSSSTLSETAKPDGGSAKEPPSWYADGVYQTSGASVASSTGSSGVSTGCSGDDHSHSMFQNEPLYQIYSAAKLESISRDIEMEGEEHSEGYEEVGNTSVRHTNDVKRQQSVRPSALQLVSPKQGPSRTLWCEIPEVINSQILATLSTTEKRLQEAKFEILTSEASYLKSLSLLRTHFMNHPAFRDPLVLSAADRKTLFSYMVAVQECSDRLLCDLETCWQDNIMLLGLSHSVCKHAEKYFHVYVAYCEHQAKLDRTLKRLKEPKNGASSAFAQQLQQLESDPLCCGLSLHSFLMLPMQRITRLPLLVDAVFGRLRADDDEYDSWKTTLALVGRVVAQCNEAANRSAQAYEMQLISRQIEFPQSIRPVSIVPVGTGKLVHRALVRSGELTHIVWRGDDGKLTFGKRFSRTPMHAFLFTDLLVLARRRDSVGKYLVVDYCERQLLTVTSGDVIPQLPTRDVPQAGKHLVCMTLLENHDGKMTEMIFACSSETDRQRWLAATEPPASDNPDEKLYEQWDCPQVTAKHAYVALQPDELGLEAGDVVNVFRKMADGWYQGERLRDGVQGWFPGNYTEEEASGHVRARNLKQRYRLLTFTAAYLGGAKANKQTANLPQNM